MLGRTVDYLRRLNAPREVEDSRQLRAAVWASVSVSLLALALQGVIAPGMALASIALISAGSLISWRRRYRPNLGLKAAIMALTVAALVSFLRQVMLEPYDPRAPLAELFVWVQVLHSFDLPRGKDLLLSLISSLIILALAGSFSISASFGLIVLLWLAAAVPALYFMQLSRLHGLSTQPERADLPRTSLWRLAALFAVLVLAVSACGLAVGAFMPRVSMTYLRSLPFSIRRAFLPPGGYRFSNPGYPDLPARPPDNAQAVNPEAYFGFGPYLDLRARGTLVDLPVMRVRSTEPAYWRGMAFREYNGYSWLAPEEEPERLRTRDQPFELFYDARQPHAATRTVVQTYYLEAEQPNIIFASYRPELLYYPSDYVYRDDSGLKSPFPLDDGLVYSVVSHYVDPEGLAGASRLEAMGEELSPYLQLPSLPERVERLAWEVAGVEGGPLARALAIEDFLKGEYEYSLDVPPLPAGDDAVDNFLFESRRGYCEHFAAAYAVLCRLVGVPSRVVTGYSTGDYNPFTGLYEVSLGDAHAWVEIYLEGTGWVAREPTPGFALPQPGQGSGSLWVFRDFFSWMGRTLSALLPAPLRSALKSLAASALSAASSLLSGILYSLRESPWLLFPFAAVISCYPAARALRRRRRAPPAPQPGPGDGPLLAMRGFLAALEALGMRRDPSQTAAEFLGELAALVPEADLSRELELFERARYGRRPLRAEESCLLQLGLAAALEQVRRRARPRLLR